MLYNQFKHYCGVAYNCLRRHAPIFYVLLLNLTECIPIVDERITKEHIRNHILERFIPGENYEDAQKQFNYKVDNNSNTYSEDIIDFFHKQYKSTSGSASKSLSETSNNYISKATETATHVKNNMQHKWNTLSKMFR